MVYTVRVSHDKIKYKDWIDLFAEYVVESSYRKKNNLKGFAGVIDAMRARKELELSIMDKLPINTFKIDNNEYNWDEVFNEIVDKVSKFI